MLEWLLGEAKAGAVRWMGVAYIDAVGVGHSTYEPAMSSGIAGNMLTAAMGAVSFLDKRLCAAALEGVVHTEAPPPSPWKA
ncbi:MAG: hypothetical protein KGL39_54165 [Patescibacteria group bacterium]|nr:hypothetical protein [Patescibacteria group bacterium]